MKGDPIFVGEFRGLIRYVGAVDGKPGSYLGIDWDDATRGKHDGSFNGKKYFSTRHKTSGSFLPAQHKDICTGLDLCDVIEKRYFSGDNEVESNNLVVHHVKKELPNVALPSLPIKTCISKRMSFPHCSDLVISYSLLTSWKDLADMMTLFPVLSFLDISGNYMETLDDTNVVDVDGSQIKTLMANKCGITKISNLLVVFPNLTDLYLCENGIQEISSLPSSPNLKVLHLSGNQFDTTEKLAGLRSCPNLEYVNLSYCSITSIKLNDDCNPLKNVNSLNLEANEFGQNSPITDLFTLKNLQRLTLRMYSPPVNGVSFKELIVACMPNLIELDRFDVSPLHRRNCELQFLQGFASQKANYPQYSEIIERLITLHEYVIEEQPEVTEATTLRLNFMFEGENVAKEFDLDTPMKRVINIICRKFGVSPREVKVAIRRFNEGGDYFDEEISLNQNFNIDKFELPPQHVIIITRV